MEGLIKFKVMIVLRTLMLSLFFLSVLLQPKDFALKADIDKHLSTYSEFNSYKHDNIDDEEKPHEHMHRHSENGEEHEHGHGHGKIPHQLEMKLANLTSEIKFHSPTLNEVENYSLKSLISSPHLQEIFRPPVA